MKNLNSSGTKNGNRKLAAVERQRKYKGVKDQRCSRWVGYFVLLASPAFSTAAWAQLEEVVVTARKIEERLQETPISMTVFSADQIESFGFDDLSDIGRFSPNVVVDQGTGNTGSSNNSQFFIRGVGQVDFLFTSDPGVGVYIDDVYLPRVTGSMLDLVDMERIEILRGPQGTLFGKNTIGGAIVVVSKGPEDELGGSATVTAGSRDRLDAKGSINVPLIEDQLSGRLSVSTRNQDGYVDRVLVGGKETGNVNSDAIRGQLLWTPGSDWQVSLNGDYTRSREEAIANELLEVNTAAPALQLWNLLVAPSYGPGTAYDEKYLSPDWKSQATGPSYSDLDDWGVSLIVTKEINDHLEVKSITAYRETHAKFGIDVDYSPLTYLQTSNNNDHDQLSQEIRLTGAGFGDRLSWVTGLFYMHESGNDVFDLDLANGLYDALEAFPGGLIPGLGGQGNPAHIPLDLDATFFDGIKIDGYAVYTQGTFDWNEKWSTTVGIRYTDDKKDFNTMMIRNASGVIAVPKTQVSASWDATTPHASIDYKWTSDVMTYISASRGFKSGGFNGRAQAVSEIVEFDPEYVWSYELGLKSEWFDRRLMANLAVFYNDYSDIQLTSVRDEQGLLVVATDNAGEAEMKGFELDFAAQITESLLLRGGLGYLDAKYTKLNPGATVTLDSQLVKTPKWTGNLTIENTWSLNDMGSFKLGGDVSYRSSHFNEPSNYALLKQDAYTLFGAHASYLSPGEQWRVTLYGTNLSDERYMTNGIQALEFLGTADAAYGKPREWGVSLNASF